MNALEQYLAKQLAQRSQKGILRTLKTSDPTLIDFTSNDYLGLSRSPELIQQIAFEFETLKLRTGSTGSRLLSGNSSLCQQLENDLTVRFAAEACLLFNSGYAANLGVLSSIPSRNDTILYDELCHASIKDGIRLSLATRHSFKHNDLNDLEQKLKRSKGKKFIVVESLYSMDGDVSPLANIVKLAEEFDSFVVLDEAHSTGVLGKNGAGLAVSLDLHQKISIRIYTFGKAMGCHGACVAGSKDLVAYLVNFSKPFIYTTALPDHTIVSLIESFKFVADHPELQTTLTRKIRHFTTMLKSATPRSDTAIQTIQFNSVTSTKNKSDKLLNKGFDVRPIFSPTVPEGTERLRICLHTFNSDEDITRLANELNTP